MSLHFLRYEDLNIEHIYLDGAPVARLNTVMRKMMDYAYALADERRIPVILDTDDRDKAARYEHLGMKLDRVRSCGERFHMYDLIRFDDALLGGRWTLSRKRKLSVSITSPPVPVMLPDRGCNMVTVPYINVVATGQNIDRMRIAAGFP